LAEKCDLRRRGSRWFDRRKYGDPWSDRAGRHERGKLPFLSPEKQLNLTPTQLERGQSLCGVGDRSLQGFPAGCVTHGDGSRSVEWKRSGRVFLQISKALRDVTDET